MTKDNYIGILLTVAPEFDAAYQEHIKLYGERLDYPLFGELFRFTKQAYDTHQFDLVEQIAQFLNQVAADGDEDMQDILHTSFMEYLPRRDMSSADFEAHLSGQLTAPAKAIYEAVLGILPSQV